MCTAASSRRAAGHVTNIYESHKCVLTSFYVQFIHSLYKTQIKKDAIVVDCEIFMWISSFSAQYIVFVDCGIHNENCILCVTT